MANVMQAVFDNGDIVIHCDSRWSCCQRAQAAAKVRAMNQRLKVSPKPQIQSDITHLSKSKRNCQEAAERKWNKMDKDEKKAHMKKVGGPECVTDGRSQDPDDLQQDHPLDAKLGGEADSATLRENMIPTDKFVNGAFGQVAQKFGDKMLAEGTTEVESISLVCPSSSPGCTTEDHNAGTRKKLPDDPTPKKTRTLEVDFKALG